MEIVWIDLSLCLGNTHTRCCLQEQFQFWSCVIECCIRRSGWPCESESLGLWNGGLLFRPLNAWIHSCLVACWSRWGISAIWAQWSCKWHWNRLATSRHGEPWSESGVLMRTSTPACVPHLFEFAWIDCYIFICLNFLDFFITVD